jgi:hypothetical protein
VREHGIGGRGGGVGGTRVVNVCGQAGEGGQDLGHHAARALLGDVRGRMGDLHVQYRQRPRRRLAQQRHKVGRHLPV